MTAYSFARRLSRVSLLAPMLVAAATVAQAAVEISANPTKNMNCTGGVCTPTAEDAVLNVIDLAGMLAGDDTTIKSTSANPDIEIDAALSWTSPSRLTLDSYRAIVFNKPVVVAGLGAMTITANDGGSGGDFSFLGKGHVELWDVTSSLVINGEAYTLVNSLPSLAAALRANGSGLFALAKNYNAGKRRDYKASPIKHLSGTLEGLGNAISNLSINVVRGGRQPKSTGLVSISTGTIRDLALLNATVASSNINSVVGALVGWNEGSVIQCSMAGAVTGRDAGGLIGINNGGTISSSSATASVQRNAANDGALGGLAGFNENAGFNSAIITLSSSSGSVGGNQESGGLVGRNTGTISLSHSSSAMSGETYDGMGGLVGYNATSGIISQSYAEGPLTEGSSVGGLVGINSGITIQSYATGSASGGPAGGLVSVNDGGSIAQSYATGAPTGDQFYKAGGLVGYDESKAGNITVSYWDTDTSGITNPDQGAGNVPDDPGIAPLFNAQLKSGLPDGFDPAIWGQKKGINKGRPYLLANPPQ